MNCKCCKQIGSEKNVVLPSFCILRGKDKESYSGRIIIKNTLICDECNKKFDQFY